MPSQPSRYGSRQLLLGLTGAVQRDAFGAKPSAFGGDEFAERADVNADRMPGEMS